MGCPGCGKVGEYWQENSRKWWFILLVLLLAFLLIWFCLAIMKLAVSFE